MACPFLSGLWHSRRDFGKKIAIGSAVAAGSAPALQHHQSLLGLDGRSNCATKILFVLAEKWLGNGQSRLKEKHVFDFLQVLQFDILLSLIVSTCKLHIGS